VLELVPNRWYGRAVLMCEQCGDFPDFSAQHAPEPLGGVRAVSRARPRVLLVDDSEQHLELYRSMLDGLAIVRTTQQGHAAVYMAAAEHFDAIVLDVMMPGMDGWEVCRRLKDDPGTADIPIVMLTSLDGKDVPSRAREMGAAAVLMKPCPVERLMLVLNAALRQRGAERAGH
jgi:CheY-like chemotaxis protein